MGPVEKVSPDGNAQPRKDAGRGDIRHLSQGDLAQPQIHEDGRRREEEPSEEGQPGPGQIEEILPGDLMAKAGEQPRPKGPEGHPQDAQIQGDILGHGAPL